jgi:hypothetical protein
MVHEWEGRAVARVLPAWRRSSCMGNCPPAEGRILAVDLQNLTYDCRGTRGSRDCHFIRADGR